MSPRKFLNSWVSEREFPAFWGRYSHILGCGTEQDLKIFQITFETTRFLIDENKLRESLAWEEKLQKEIPSWAKLKGLISNYSKFIVYFLAEYAKYVLGSNNVCSWRPGLAPPLAPGIYEVVKCEEKRKFVFSGVQEKSARNYQGKQTECIIFLQTISRKFCVKTVLSHA